MYKRVLLKLSGEALSGNGQPFDPEVFQRVWKRVMPDQKYSPIEVASSASLSSSLPSPVQEAKPQSSCLGDSSQPYAQMIEELMDETLALIRTLQRLSRRSGFRTVQVLSSLIASLQQEQRRLSVAYFLITGTRHRPMPSQLSIPTGLDKGLRALYQYFHQRSMLAYQHAEKLSDPCLQQLLQTLGDHGESSAARLRHLLEMME